MLLHVQYTVLNPQSRSREDHLQAVASRDAPQAGSAVVTCSECGAAVLRQRHLVEAADMALQHSSAAAIRQVPHPACKLAALSMVGTLNSTPVKP
jgi:hypothetical protein